MKVSPTKPRRRLVSSSSAPTASRILPVLLSAFMGFHFAPAARGNSAPNIAPQQPGEVRRLAPGETIERRISGGQTHLYEVTLSPGQFFHLTVDQRGVDLVLVMSGPSGQKLIEAESPNGDRGPEILSLVAEEAGRPYRVEVKASGQATTAGDYQLTVEEIRPAGEQDRARVAAAGLLQEGHLKGKAGDTRLAAEKYGAARDLFRRARDRRGEAAALGYLGRALVSQGAGDEGVARLTEAAAIWRELNDRRGECSILKALGDAYAGLAEEKKAFEHLDRAIGLARAVGDRPWEAGLLLDSAALVLDQRQQALDNLASALSIYRDLGDKESVAWTLNNIGAFYVNLGEYPAASTYFDQALALWREMGDRRMEAFQLRNIGQIYRHTGRYAQALDHMDRALTIFRAIIPNQHAATLEVMGEVYALTGERQKALDHFNRALSLRKGLGSHPANPVAFPRLLLNLARLHRDMGERDRALEYLDQTLGKIPEIQFRDHHAIRQREAGELYSSLGDHAKAIGLFRQALEIDRAIGIRGGEAETLAALARAERDLGRLADARAHVEAAVGIVESFRTRFDDNQLRAAYTASVQQYYDLLIDILMRLHAGDPSGGFAAAAVETSERKRARSLLELLAEGGADIRGGVAPALLERERRLQRRLNASAARHSELLTGRHTAGQAAEAAAEVTLLTTEYQRVRSEIRQQSPRYAALTQPPTLRLGEIQAEVLDADTVLLEYALGDERSFLWAVTRDSVTVRELPKRAEVEAEARKVYELLTARNRPVAGETIAQRRARLAQADRDYDVAAARLSRTLLGPARAVLGAKRLLVVGDGALHYVPFAALPDPTEVGGGTPPPLVAGHEVVVLPSASVLAAIRRETRGRKPAARAVAVLADPVFDAGDPRLKAPGVAGARPSTQDGPRAPSDLERTLRDFAPTGERAALARLPFTRDEAEAIMRFVPAGAGRKALDFEASREVAASAELAEYRVVHFATHGLLNTEQPALSGLVFSLVDEKRRRQDGFLRLHEIYNLNLPAELVVLSACQTGLGREVSGEGLVGLTRGFMYAGARRVAASLWKVDDSVTAEFMGRFYREMLDGGKSPAAALRAAQVEMWRRKQWGSPYFWAAFVLQGEYR